MLTSNANRQLSELDRDLIEQRIHAFWGMRRRGEVAELASLVAEDCVYVGRTWVGHPADIRREGREACLEWARELSRMAVTVKMEVLHLLIDGEQAVACRRITFRDPGSQRTEDVMVCSFMRFRNGEMAELIEYPDMIAISRLFAD